MRSRGFMERRDCFVNSRGVPGFTYDLMGKFYTGPNKLQSISMYSHELKIETGRYDDL